MILTTNCLEVTIQGKTYPMEIIRKNNKNTYVRIKQGRIVVTTSKYTTIHHIKKLIGENEKAILKMIKRKEREEKRQKEFLLFGEPYDIEYGEFDRQIYVEKGRIEVVDEEILLKWLDKFIHHTFYSHLMYYHSLFEERIPYPNLKIRSMKSRWGVCNRKNNNITLNFELFRYPMECLDYVIVHELSHFLVPNHSKEFWSVVEKYYPNYKEVRKKLRS